MLISIFNNIIWLQLNNKLKGFQAGFEMLFN